MAKSVANTGKVKVYEWGVISDGYLQSNWPKRKSAEFFCRLAGESHKVVRLTGTVYYTVAK